MNADMLKSGLLDRVAMTLSGLCLIHCLATALLLGALSTVGGILGNPAVHEYGLVLAIVFGVLALGNGIRVHRKFLPLVIGAVGISVMSAALTLPHGGWETIVTMLGVALLATGHFLNRLALD